MMTDRAFHLALSQIVLDTADLVRRTRSARREIRLAERMLASFRLRCDDHREED